MQKRLATVGTRSVFSIICFVSVVQFVAANFIIDGYISCQKPNKCGNTWTTDRFPVSHGIVVHTMFSIMKYD